MLAAIRGAKETINFETYIYWSGAIGKEFADALAERARAGVKVHVLLDWVGSQKMDEALVAEMKSAGVEIQKYHPPHWSHLGRLNNRTHRKLLVVDGRSASPAASASPTSGAATRRTPTTGATRTSRSRDRWSRRCRPSSWTTGSRPPARCCTAVDYFPPLAPVGERRGAGVQQLAERRQRQHGADVPAVDHRGEADDPPLELVLRPRRARRRDAGRGAQARREAADHHARRAHRHRDRARAPRARAGASCSRPAPRSTSTSRRCTTAR